MSSSAWQRPQLALPEGDGAIRGMGEKYLRYHTGTGFAPCERGFFPLFLPLIPPVIENAL
jgi:hypothetical protein